jgi:8-oxo-dGTP pyrophosphatase MutT (NUDIX family)
MSHPIDPKPAPDSVRQRLEPALRPLLHLWWRLSRGLTFGVRAVILRADGAVFLIKHSYTPGWHLPGGGVEAGETALEALAREVLEEGAIRLEGEPVLHGLFHNARVSRRDHVAVYVVRAWSQPSAPVPDREIIAHGFFPPDALPQDTSPATRRRIAEVLGGLPPDPLW